VMCHTYTKQYKQPQLLELAKFAVPTGIRSGFISSRIGIEKTDRAKKTDIV